MQTERRWLFIFPYKRQGDARSWDAQRGYMRKVPLEQPPLQTPVCEAAGDDWWVYIEMDLKAFAEEAQEERFDEMIDAAEKLADECFKKLHPGEKLSDDLKSRQLPS